MQNTRTMNVLQRLNSSTTSKPVQKRKVGFFPLTKGIFLFYQNSKPLSILTQQKKQKNNKPKIFKISELEGKSVYIQMDANAYTKIPLLRAQLVRNGCLLHSKLTHKTHYCVHQKIKIGNERKNLAVNQVQKNTVSVHFLEKSENPKIRIFFLVESKKTMESV